MSYEELYLWRFKGIVMDGLKVRFKGETDFLVLTHDKVYDVKAIEKGWYRIVDDSGEDYLYPTNLFDIVEED